MGVLTDMAIILIVLPLAIMMMVFVNGRDAFPSTMMLFWKVVLFLSGEKMPESRAQRAERMVEGTRLFKEHAQSLEQLIQPNDPNARRFIRQQRYQDHYDWSERSGIWLGVLPTSTQSWPQVSRPCKHHPSDQVCYRCGR
jgi:hypothetical protein